FWHFTGLLCIKGAFKITHATTPAGNNTNAAFDEAGIGFGAGLNGITMQQDFTSAAQRHAVRCANHREWRFAHGLVNALAEIDHIIDYTETVELHRQLRK